jgi:hypothetical protein
MPLSNSSVPISPRTWPAAASTPREPSPNLNALLEQPLKQVLSAHREGRIDSSILLSMLRRSGCAAADELLALCKFATTSARQSTADAAKLRDTVISLFVSPPPQRTLDQLRDTGMFRTRLPHEWPDRNDLELLSSDEGLLLWLEYGSTPDGYQRLFFDYVSQFLRVQAIDEPPAMDIGPALRVLVAVGRDAANDVPDPFNTGQTLPPLTHLCAIHAPEWLPFLLDIGVCANQCDREGNPLLYRALVAVTRAARDAGRTPREMTHDLEDCVALMVEHRTTLMVSDLEGTPLTVRLIRDGYIDAARVLLQFDASPSATDAEMNSVLHHLAKTLQPAASQSSAAVVAFIAALAAGADPHLPNARGETAINLLPPPQREHFRFVASHYLRWSHSDVTP